MRHWVDKNCFSWSKEYFNENIVNTKYENVTYTFVITSLNSISGDCDVTQRKGKVLCIYDMKLLFSVEGSKKVGDEPIDATITIDEFFHDQEEDDYFFVVASEFASDVKKLLVPVLRGKLQRFQDDLIKAHERDVQHATGQ